LTKSIERFGRYRSLIIPLVAGSVACLLVVLFLHLGSEVNEGETRRFDNYVLHGAQALRAARPWLADMMRDLSGLGSTVVLALLTVGACGYLALTSAWSTSVIVALSVSSGAAAVELLKSAFGRLRPQSAFAQFVAPGLSFPSGHSSMSAVVFLTLGVLLARMHDRSRERWFIMGAATLCTLLVGVSRAALGVHWSTDVLGGWAFGMAWATIWLLVARQLDRRAVLARTM
jgi:undecaprenyl-diphosphatase